MDPISRKTARLLLWLGLAALALSAFLGITKEMFEGKVSRMDRAQLLAIARMRTPWLTAGAIAVTALGSTRVLIVLVAATIIALLAVQRYYSGLQQSLRYDRGTRNRLELLQVVVAASGAGLLTLLTKGIIERPRPEVIPWLVAATGSSYPSGHSLGATAIYLTIAIVIAPHLRRRSARILMVVLAGLLAALIAFSRVYLGVHYPSDAASGVALGAAWAFLVAAGFSAE